ncbi:hypothetical protein GUITHDRAFT_112776 [Guillardia theta CCMP2712]|uniref:RWP-RK domain-containing protein n=1 Tax=Guillardia theta (strain CCMP2712) TaxID=905079 RepID=L1IXN4_GUITC|nr:hypothetical protein GUITHDRAFT_112776 [Guillardia theta CCMP2712]EKX41038.1 hypothetical protein GUITHDRAFT_112776 [Guillardia theta CCMP2712]|eukprot:XP_005828018.1 hypothetical protein GUITHDRAFT_112776 [Guillardia theta CCMP2712]
MHNSSTAATPKKNRAIRKNCIIIHPSKLQTLFCYKESEAAKMLGISLTAMKNVCRRAGITKWPYSRSRQATTPPPTSPPSAYAAVLTSAIPEEHITDCGSSSEGLDPTGAQEGEAWGWEEDECPLEAGWIEWYMRSEED